MGFSPIFRKNKPFRHPNFRRKGKASSKSWLVVELRVEEKDRGMKSFTIGVIGCDIHFWHTHQELSTYLDIIISGSYLYKVKEPA